MIRVSNLNPGHYQWFFIASHKSYDGPERVYSAAYLDDFLVIDPTQLRCKVAFDTLLNLLESLGFTINWSKVVYPAQCLIFLGVEINTVQCELRLSDDPVSVLLSLLNVTSSKRKCTKLHPQRLLDNLHWAACVVRGGGTFLRRLITLANGVKRLYHLLYLNLNARADLASCGGSASYQHTTVNLCSPQPSKNFPQQFVLIPPRLVGGEYGQQTGCMPAGPWISHLFCFLHINYRETFTIVLAAHCWAPFWSGHRVIVKTDS